MSYVDKVAVGGTTYDIRDSNSVQIVEQTLTDEQKVLARSNIDAASVESVQEFEDTGLVMIDGKLCVKVERS